MEGARSIGAAARTAAAQAGLVARSTDWRLKLARAGLVAKGVLYGSLGLLAIRVANGRASTRTVTREGAVELVASQPLGHWLLVLFTVGLFALATWQAIVTFTGDPVEGSEPKDRAKFASKAILYAATAFTALSMWMTRAGIQGASRRGGSSEDQAAGMIMSWPGGPWIVGLLGLVIVTLAVFQLYSHAYRKEFMRRLSVTDGGEVARNVERAGTAGYAARGVVLLVVGVFFVVAAIQHDPSEAVGLSGALRVLAQQSWGQAVLWFVAIGLLLYGAFCFAEARYRRAA